MISVASIRALCDELTKLAALTEQEASSLKDAIRQHAKFDAASASGGLSPEDQAAMRANVERIKQYREKQRGVRPKVDTWVGKPGGMPPPPKPPPGAGPRGYRAPRWGAGAPWEYRPRRQKAWEWAVPLGVTVGLYGAAAYAAHNQQKAQAKRRAAKAAKTRAKKRAAKQSQQPSAAPAAA